MSVARISGGHRPPLQSRLVFGQFAWSNRQNCPVGAQNFPRHFFAARRQKLAIHNNLRRGRRADGVLDWDLLRGRGMVAITGRVSKNGQDTMATVFVPANNSEARGTSVGKWGLVIAGGLLLLASTFICLILLAA